MRVIEVQTSQDERRYVVIDDQGIMIEPIVRYLKYLDRIGAARNTLHSYAAQYHVSCHEVQSIGFKVHQSI